MSIIIKEIRKEILTRFRDNASSADASSKRYIITAPQDDFILLPSDQVTHFINNKDVKNRLIFCMKSLKLYLSFSK